MTEAQAAARDAKRAVEAEATTNGPGVMAGL